MYSIAPCTCIHPARARACTTATTSCSSNSRSTTHVGYWARNNAYRCRFTLPIFKLLINQKKWNSWGVSNFDLVFMSNIKFRDQVNRCSYIKLLCNSRFLQSYNYVVNKTQLTRTNVMNQLVSIRQFASQCVAHFPMKCLVSNRVLILCFIGRHI